MAARAKHLRVKAGELRPRLSGFSLFPPNVEFSLPEPGPDERDMARRILAYLEDRRVLYAPESLEVQEHCIASVFDIRRELTSVIGQLDDESDLVASLRTMRAACRKFLDAVGSGRGPGLLLPGGSYGDWEFGSAMGELRGVMGVCVATLAARFVLDVEAPLSSILPVAPTEAD